MIEPPLPPNEDERLAALRRYNILDTEPEAAFDDITRLAAQICEAPIAVINLIDSGRQWFKSEIGLGVRETPLDISICAHAILQPGLFVVPDTLKDERFRGNPLVKGDPFLRFYAGALLATPDGQALGTVCVLDHQPRELTPLQGAALTALARQTMAQLELRQALRQAERLNRHHNRLMAVAGHDLKQPLQVISMVLGRLDRETLDVRDQERLDHADTAVDQLARGLDGLALAAQLDDSMGPLRQAVPLGPLLQQVARTWWLHAARKSINLRIVDTSAVGLTDPAMLKTALGNLIGNAIKYTRPRGSVLVGVRRHGSYARIEVCDTGIGIAPEKLGEIFEAFHQLDPEDAEGLGLGLAIVRRTADMLEHPVSVRSELGGGSCFGIAVPLMPSCEGLRPEHQRRETT